MRRLYLVIAIIAIVVVVFAIGGWLTTGGGWLRAEPAGSGQVQSSAAP